MFTNTMGNAMLLLLVPLLSLIMASSTPSTQALVQDFCVGDLARGDTPAGYPCKPEAAVTADDFSYRGLSATGPTIEPFNIALSSAFSPRFPGVNGLGISAAIVHFGPGGVVPLHSHPGGSELLFVVEGTLSAGFISSVTNKVYTQTLRKGDLMVFPQGLLHFQIATGAGAGGNDDNATAPAAVALSMYSSSNPGLQILDFALFANNLPSDVLSKVSVLDELQIKKLKSLFRGTG
ncbi:germin-like protein 8-14 [Oryza brachyantha]|uniref:germin-like protein 8-14 n=1 Tax=Oryza brachyantha TaxID=4533 RepID=UPI001ADC8691|nr:germin-like protein 8-14 [Oryza brachyantha]